MPSADTVRLLAAARSQIDELKIGIPDDRFVCHLCLRLMPVSRATTGHYPSRKAGGGRRALQCKDCNNRLGTEIEAKAAAFLADDRWAMTAGPPGGGTVQIPVRVDGRDAPNIDFKARGATRAWQQVRALQKRSSRPDVLVCRMERPHPDALKMALLAWSFAEWSNYSGYSYTASAGAHMVRRMLLDGSVPIPTAAVVFFEDQPTAPLGEPHPVLVVHADKEVKDLLRDIDEVLGIGVSWGEKMTAILPAATDAAGDVYAKVEALHSAGKKIRYFALRPIMSQLGFDRLDQILVISDEDSGWSMGITDAVQQGDRERLSRDDHQRRLDPTLPGLRRSYPPGQVREFYLVEDTVGDYAPLPPVKPKRTRRGGVQEQFDSFRPLVGVRNGEKGPWHIATHIRMVANRPKDYMVFCGSSVTFPDSTQRMLSGIGFDGRGFVCSACVEVMMLKPASERPRPTSSARPKTPVKGPRAKRSRVVRGRVQRRNGP